ncbi:MAG: tyrosine-type recombinase/integrase [Nitrospira sp.]|nr:tyrosine-type recombinase/integrase [Nitrospira sp.]
MLTEGIVKEAKPKATAYLLWDEKVRGLAVRVFPKGAKSYILMFTDRGKRVMAKLARVEETTLKEIRVRAASELLKVRAGEDSLQTRRQAIRNAPTFADLWTRYETEFAPERIELGRMTKRTLMEYGKIMRRHVLPVLGEHPVNAITRTDIERTAKRMTGTPTLRNRALAIMSRLMNLAEAWEWRGQNSNPVKGITRAREEARSRIFSPEEMQRLNTVLLELQDQYPCEVGAVFVATLTGLRISEVLSLEWSNVHLETSRATLSRTKTGKRIVVLAGPVKDILAGLPRIEGNESCFPSVYDRRGMTATTYKSARRIFAMACERANLHDGRLHDLRRSFLTMRAGAGFGAFAIRDAAGHKTLQMANRYVQQGATLSQTAEQGAALVLEKMTGKAS